MRTTFNRLFAAVLFVSVALVSFGVHAQGLDADRLQQIDALFEDYVAKGLIPGGTSLIAQGGKVIHFQTYGSLSMETKTPLPDDAIFRIYSMSKPITSAALMMLWEEGKFKLDDPVSKYLPEFADMQVFKGMNEDGTMQTAPAKSAMTIRQLMSHTSGLTYGFFTQTPVDKAYLKNELLYPHLTLAEFSKRLATIPLLVEPGEKWIYSVSVDLQGYLVEVLSGMPFGDFLKTRLFEPLGMQDTGFYVPEDKLDRLITLYTHTPDGVRPSVTGKEAQDFTQKPAFQGGGGGLVSTTHDYWRFAQMMANGGEIGGTRYLKAGTVALMHENHLPDRVKGIGFDPNYDFGLGFKILKSKADDKERGNLGEYSWSGMANTQFWIDPQDDIVAVFMVNTLPSNGAIYIDKYKEILYGE